MTQRWKLTIEYDGTDFCGWQRQNDDITVQQVLEEAIYAFSGEDVRLHVAGRTDSGVHALAQIAHFDLEKEYRRESVQGAINFFRQNHKVSVLSAEPVGLDFHARFHAKARSYCYHLCNRRGPLTLKENQAWHYPHKLDLGRMQEAADLLIGHHDFTTFRAHRCQATSCMRTLDYLNITQEDDMFYFETKAQSFLYHQVRNMVGTLALVGTGKWSLDDFKKAFKACDRKEGGPTAPPEGLYFIHVDYDDQTVA